MLCCLRMRDGFKLNLANLADKLLEFECEIKKGKIESVYNPQFSIYVHKIIK